MCSLCARSGEPKRDILDVLAITWAIAHRPRAKHGLPVSVLEYTRPLRVPSIKPLSIGKTLDSSRPLFPSVFPQLIVMKE